MLYRPLLLLQVILTLSTLSLAAPRWYEKYRVPRVVVPQSYYEVLKTPANPRAVADITCLDPRAHIISHDDNAASLAICGGIEGGAPATTRCSGAPRETTGRSGTALFTLRALDPSGVITMSKERWVQCVRAARDVCPTGSMSGVCLGGASKGDVGFTLTAV